MEAFRRQLEKGAIQKTYRALLSYMMGLHRHACGLAQHVASRIDKRHTLKQGFLPFNRDTLGTLHAKHPQRIWVLFATLLFLFVGCAANPHADTIAAVESDILFARIFGDEEVTSLEERMAQLNVPGVSVAVALDGELAWARAYGMADMEEGRPVTTQTLFQAASISKPVAAAAMLSMADEGLIDLDTNVNTYLTSWQVPENAFTQQEKVTLRRIVNHTAGLTVWGFPGYARTARLPSTVEILSGGGNTDSVQAYKEPGESWQYSGGGYTVMQQLLADVADKPFVDLMQERVLAPAGMTASGYFQPLPEHLHPQAASGYTFDGSNVVGKWHVYPEMAAAGLWTTPSDLLRFAITLQKDLEGAGVMLNAETAEAMLTPGENNHGLGPGISEDGLHFGHGGANEGFRCRLIYFKNGRGGVAVMTNSDNGTRLAHEILLSIAREYDWPGLEPERIDVVELDDAAYEALVGTYAFEQGDVKVAYENGRLVATSWFGYDIVLMPTSPTTFAARDEGLRISFEMEDGDARALIWNGRRRGVRKQ